MVIFLSHKHFAHPEAEQHVGYRADCRDDAFGVEGHIAEQVVVIHVVGGQNGAVNTRNNVVCRNFPARAGEKNHGIDHQQSADNPQDMFRTEQNGHNRRGTVAKRQPRHHAEDSQLSERVRSLAERFAARNAVAEFGEPGYRQADKENHHRAAHDFPEQRPRELKLEFPQRDKSRDAHNEHKEREHQVGGC